MKSSFKNISGSKLPIALIVIFWISAILVYRPWQKNLIVNDVVSYYGYLPAAFIHHDLRLSFTENTKEYKHKFWPEKAANGGKVIKTTMGLSYLYAPFFLAGHVVAVISGAPRDGFSMPYQMGVVIGGLFYFILGLYFLRRLLLLYFSEKVTGWTILSVFAGTNLLWYSTLDNLMSHQYIFSLLCIFMYYVIEWHRQQKWKTAVIIGLSGGLLVLIRPPMVLCVLIFLLFNVYDRHTLKEKLGLLMRNKTGLLLMLLNAVLVFLPQLFYWKYVTGHWFFVSYVNERFYLAQPHLWEGLFGFRKGWFLYTPLMLFSVLGLFALKKKVPELFLPALLLLCLTIYLFLSWWAWWYGGSFGNRAFIDWYPVFVFPIAALYSRVFEQSGKMAAGVLAFFAIFFCCLNVFQTWQYNRELIHYDSMTKAAYFNGFFATEKTKAWEELLDEPAYDRAKNGLPEIYLPAEIDSIKPADVICLKGANRLMVSGEFNTDMALRSSKNYVAAWETFSFVRMDANKIAIIANNKKYVCADHGDGDKLKANKDRPSTWETFELIYLGNNRVALRSDNGKYVDIGFHEPYALTATGDSITIRTMFRIYIN